MNDKADLLGVVLCGGESKRMGSDKGLLQLNGKTWAEQIAQKLKDQNLPVVISINEKQLALYKKLFEERDLVIDQLPMHGPLNGLLTVYEKFPIKNILLMACDLIDMEAFILEELITTYEKNEADYFAYEENDFFQPLCAIYTSKALTSLHERLTNGSLANYSFQYILNNSKTYHLHTSSLQAFTNYNTLQNHSSIPSKKSG
jgi:molybdopterin-guanine dinucleotide biosynthesis protein A